MAQSRTRFFASLLAVLEALVHAKREISSMTVLLPAEPDARFKLEASGGKYSWKSLLPSLVEIKESDDGTAILGVGSSIRDGKWTGGEGGKKTTIVAVDRNTNEEVRCDVRVAEIAKIKVDTSARRINVDDMDTLKIEAYDQSGNHFSTNSLEGLSFDWSIKNPDILKPGRLHDTPGHKISTRRKAIEKNNKYSDQIVVWGRVTGKTNVQATFKPFKGKGNFVKSAEVPLIIMENLELVPRALTTVRGAEVDFGLKVLKSGLSIQKTPFVDLPSDNFHFEVLSDNDGAEQHTMSISTQKKSGSNAVLSLGLGGGAADGDDNAVEPSVVRALDTRIENNSAESYIKALEPEGARLVIAPEDAEEIVKFDSRDMESWERLTALASTTNLIEGNRYVAILALDSKNRESLALPANLHAHFSCEEPCIIDPTEQQESSSTTGLSALTSNKWAVAFTAANVGGGVIGFHSLSLAGLTGDVQDPNIAAYAGKLASLGTSEQIQVLKGVSVSQTTLILPTMLGAENGEQQEQQYGGDVEQGYPLIVSGGSGNFAVSISSSSSSVSEQGEVPAVKILSSIEGGAFLRIGTASFVGDAVIKITDKANLNNVSEVLVKVRQLDSLVLRPEQQQLPFVGQEVLVPVFAKAQAIESDRIDSSGGKNKKQSQMLFDTCGNFLPQDLSVEPQRIARFGGVKQLPSASASEEGRQDLIEDNTCGLVAVHPLTTGQITISWLEKRLGASTQLTFFDPIKVEFESVLPFQPPVLTDTEHSQSSGAASEILKELTPTSAVAEIGAEILLKFSKGPVGMRYRQFLKVVGSFGSDSEDPADDVVEIAEVKQGYLLKCNREGAVKLRATFELVAEKDEDTLVVLHTSETDAGLECAEAKAIRIFSPEKPSSPLGVSNAGAVMGAECGKKHDLVAVVYSDRGEAISALKYGTTLKWTAGSGKEKNLIVGASSGSSEGEADQDSSSSQVQISLDVSENLCKKEDMIDVSVSYRVQLTDSVELSPSKPLRARWPGYPSTSLVVPAVSSSEDSIDNSFLLTVAGGNPAGALNFERISGNIKVAKPQQSSCVDSTSVCRSEWLLTPVEPTETEIVVEDSGSLGSEALKISLNFGQVGDVRFDRYTVQREAGADVRLDLMIKDDNGKNIHPHLWNQAGLICELQNAEGVLRSSVESAGDNIFKFVGDENNAGIEISSDALAVGTHTVSCDCSSASPEGKDLRAMSSITIFEKLSLVPSELVALPRQTGEFTLSGGMFSEQVSQGGSVRRRFSSSNEQVVNIVDVATGALMFVSEGEAEVTVELLVGDEVLASASGKVVVGWPAKGVIGGERQESGSEAGEVESVLKVVGSKTVDVALFTGSGAQFTPALVAFPAVSGEEMLIGADGEGGNNSTGPIAGEAAQAGERQEQQHGGSWWNITSWTGSGNKKNATAQQQQSPEYEMNSENPFSCGFRWTIEGSSLLSFASNDKREISGRGLRQVELKSLENVSDNAGVSADDTSATLVLEVACRSSSVTVRKSVDVGLPLLSSFGSSALIVPTGSEIPLTPLLRSTSGEVSATIAHVRGKGLSLDHGALSIKTDGEEADAVLHLRDLKQGSVYENAALAISSRQPDEVRLSSDSHREASGRRDMTLVLPEGSSTIINVGLFASGQKLAFSPLSNNKLSAFASHPSRVQTTVLGSSNQVRLTARTPSNMLPTNAQSKTSPCSIVQVGVKSSGGFKQTKTLRVCVAKDKLLPAPPTGSEKLLLHTGATVSFFVDPRTSSSNSAPRKFALKLNKDIGSVAASFETELRLFIKQTTNAEMVHLFVSAGETEVIFSVKSSKLSTQKLVELLWLNSSSAKLTGAYPLLSQYWDREHSGIRPITETPGVWSAASSKVLQFDGKNSGVANAVTPGETVITYASDFQQRATVTVDNVASVEFGKLKTGTKLTSFRPEQGLVLPGQKKEQLSQQQQHQQRNKETYIPLTFLNNDGSIFDTRSPFVSQNIRFTCSGERLLETLFEVNANRGSSASCVLKPKKIAAEKLLALGKLPSELGLVVSVAGGEEVKKFEMKLPFSPGFVVLDNQGAELDIGKALRLSREFFESSFAPLSLRIWTGGQRIRVNDASMDTKYFRVLAEQTSDTLMALNVVLNAPTDKINRVPALSVLLLENESGQVETLQIHVPGGQGDQQYQASLASGGVNKVASGTASNQQGINTGASTSSYYDDDEGLFETIFSTLFSFWTMTLVSAVGGIVYLTSKHAKLQSQEKHGAGMGGGYASTQGGYEPSRSPNTPAPQTPWSTPFGTPGAGVRGSRTPATAMAQEYHTPYAGEYSSPYGGAGGETAARSTFINSRGAGREGPFSALGGGASSGGLLGGGMGDGGGLGGMGGVRNRGGFGGGIGGMGRAY